MSLPEEFSQNFQIISYHQQLSDASVQVLLLGAFLVCSFIFVNLTMTSGSPHNFILILVFFPKHCHVLFIEGTYSKEAFPHFMLRKSL